MSRNSCRGLALALVLIASLGFALPAAAAGFDDLVPAREPGLLSWIWQWVGDLWTRAPNDTHTWHATIAESGDSNGGASNDPDRGALIDPNGCK